MKEITFNQSGILFYIHKFLYKKNPEDTCGYKRQLIFSFILIIITIHAALIRGILNIFFKSFRQESDNWGIKNHLIWVMLSIVCVLVGYTIIEESRIIPDFIFWSNLSYFWVVIYSFIPFLIGLLAVTIAGIIAVIIGIILYYSWTWGAQFVKWISYGIGSAFSKTGVDFPEMKETQIGVLYTGWKERWCSKIIWK